MNLQKNALDLGIVTCNEAAMLEFYRDVLELPVSGEVPVSGVGVIKKLQCGDSVIKLLVLASPPAADCATTRSENGFAGAVGYRYCTLTVRDLERVVDRCRAAGRRIAVDIVSPRPGMSAAMVEDPDGNTVELMSFN